MGDERTELDEIALQLAGDHSPELELAEARGVDHEAAGFELDQLGDRGGVLALEGPVGHLADLEVQAGLDGVQEGALADAALARERRDAAGDQGPEGSD